MFDNTESHAAIQLMQAEHVRLHQLLEQIQAAISANKRQQNQVDHLMCQLSELVESHFRHEEEGGYLKTALDRAPRLTPQADLLQEQHGMLQERIDKLRMLVHSGVESPSWWIQIEADFQQIAQTLQDHEQAEIDLLQKAFTEDIGTGD